MSKNKDIAPCLSQMTNWRHFWLFPLLIYICICEKKLRKYYCLLCLESCWVCSYIDKGSYYVILSFIHVYFISFGFRKLLWCSSIAQICFPFLDMWMDGLPPSLKSTDLSSYTSYIVLVFRPSLSLTMYCS